MKDIRRVITICRFLATVYVTVESRIRAVIPFIRKRPRKENDNTD